MLTRTNIHNDFTSADYSNISQEWYLDSELTQPVTIEKLGSYMDPQIGQISVYYRIPDIQTDTFLIYRTKDVRSRVLIEGVQCYETQASESRFYNESPGNIWNRVAISSADANKLMQIEITMVYDTNAITLDHIFWGNDTDIILSLIRGKTFALVISVALCLVGFVFICINLTVIFTERKTSLALLYLGIYAFSIGVWSMLETNVLQFVVQDARILQLADNIAMLIGNIPLFLYLDESHKILDLWIARILCYINLIYISVCIILQFTEHYDMHYMITSAAIFTLIFTLVYIIFFIRMAIIRFRNKEKISFETKLQLLGLIVLLLTTAAEAVRFRFIQSDGMDRAESIRLAMLLLVVIWGIGSQLQMIRLVKQGLQYDLVSQMAYSDILTNLGNRTAYLERLQNFEDNATTFGIVFLDINNLKMVNDNYGHENGDLLIQSAADVIRDSFGQTGLAYRIGGDEFCVLFESVECEQLYSDALKKFEEAIQKKNLKAPSYLHLQIAQGFAVCHPTDVNAVSISIAAADAAMYANKKELKSKGLSH